MRLPRSGACALWAAARVPGRAHRSAQHSDGARARERGGGRGPEPEPERAPLPSPAAPAPQMVTPRPAPARGPALLLLLLLATARGQEQDQTTDWRATLKTIRNGIHKIDTYLNAALDLLGGEDGLCQYKCSDGEPRQGGAGWQGVGGGTVPGGWGVGGKCENPSQASGWGRV